MAHDDWVTRTEQAQIDRSVAASDGCTDVHLVSSAGGDGKTILLRQIGRALGSADGIAPAAPRAGRPRWSGIVDLYHTDLNSSSGLEEHLAAVFLRKVARKEYERQRDELADKRRQAIPGKELEQAREELTNTFVAGMNDAAADRRLVIALDTAERIQYERDAVQRTAGVEDESTTVLAWLVDQIARWHNCVVLIAGRPEAMPFLRSALEKRVAGVDGVRLAPTVELGGFDAREAEDYFERKWRRALPADPKLSPEFFKRLLKVTAGNPVRLDLAFEYALQGQGFDEFHAAVMDRRAKGTPQQVDSRLINYFMEPRPQDDPAQRVQQVLEYLAVARKGLTPALLAHLSGTGEAEASALLRAVAGERGFIKHRPRDDSYYLHDALYELCDRAFLNVPDVKDLSTRIAAWYDKRLEAAGAGAREEHDLLVDSLLYRLRADLSAGYRWYLRRSDDAIRSYEVDLDLRLHNELVAFFNSPSAIDAKLRREKPQPERDFSADAAAAWVKRYLFRGQSDKALEFAGKVAGTLGAGAPARNALGRHEFDVYRAQAQIYAHKDLDGAVATLKHVTRALAGRTFAVEADDRRAKLVLGRAHNNLGFVYWIPRGHLEAALQEFDRARMIFTQYEPAQSLPGGAEPRSQLREELANTLDNKGRVYALLRHPTRAAVMVDHGLAIRQEQKRAYRTALSLNSRALVHLEFGQPHRAIKLAEEAQEICNRYGVKRGLGLVAITLGQTKRYLGNLDTIYNFDQAHAHFLASEGYLKTAVEVFAETVTEPVRLVEALNELGCTYRDWMYRMKKAGVAERPGAKKEDAPVVRDDLYAKAVDCFEQSIALAEANGFNAHLVDSSEDLARALLRHPAGPRIAEAGARLDSAAAAIPPGYKVERGASQRALRPAQKSKSIPLLQRVESYWLMLGKIELTRGRAVFLSRGADQSAEERSEWLRSMARHYMLASYYFETFSDEATRLKDTFLIVYTSFRDCSAAERVDLKKFVSEEAKEYGIKIDRLSHFYADTLGMALEG